MWYRPLFEVVSLYYYTPPCFVCAQQQQLHHTSAHPGHPPTSLMARKLKTKAGSPTAEAATKSQPMKRNSNKAGISADEKAALIDRVGKEQNENKAGSSSDHEVDSPEEQQNENKAGSPAATTALEDQVEEERQSDNNVGSAATATVVKVQADEQQNDNKIGYSGAETAVEEQLEHQNENKSGSPPADTSAVEQRSEEQKIAIAGTAVAKERPEKRKLDVENSNVGVAEKKMIIGEKLAGKEDKTFSSETAVTLNMSCPQSKVGGIIGKRGCVIAEIMRQSQCKIQINQNFPEGYPRQIALSGSQEGIFIAVKLINEIINSTEGATPSFLPHTKEEPFYISSDKVGSVIGHRGANINEILSRTGCRIQIIQENQPEGVDRLVTFQGTPKQVEEAKRLINLIVSEGINALLIPSSASSSFLPPANTQQHSTGLPVSILGAPGGPNSVEEDILPDKVGAVIGTKGATINKISNKSGARIQMNQKFPPGHPHKIIYSGTPQQIELAKHLVYTVVNYGDAALEAELNRGSGGAPGQGQVMQEINVFQSQMVRLMGPHGRNISDVQSRCGVKINIDTTPVMLSNSNIGPSGFPEATNKVTVIGSSEAVQMAVKQLYEIIGVVVAAPPFMPNFAQPQPLMGFGTVYGEQCQAPPIVPGFSQQYQPQQAPPLQYGQPMQHQQGGGRGGVHGSCSNYPQYAPILHQIQQPQPPGISTAGVFFGSMGAPQQHPPMQVQQPPQPYPQAYNPLFAAQQKNYGQQHQHQYRG